MSDGNYPEDRQARDLVHSGAQVGANLVPGVGGALATVMNQVWIPTLERRRIRWFNELSDDVATLAGEIDDLEARLSDEALLDIALKAAETATRNRSEEKRRRLRAAVLNTAIGRAAADVDEAETFLSLIDQLDERHVAMLAFLDDPRGYADRAGVQLADLYAGGLSHHVESVFPDWSREVYDEIVAALDRARLTEAASALHPVMTGASTFAARTTERGRRFLGFITHPLDADEGQ